MVSTSISFHRPVTGTQWAQIISEFALFFSTFCASIFPQDVPQTFLLLIVA